MLTIFDVKLPFPFRLSITSAKILWRRWANSSLKCLLSLPDAEHLPFPWDDQLSSSTSDFIDRGMLVFAVSSSCVVSDRLFAMSTLLQVFNAAKVDSIGSTTATFADVKGVQEQMQK